MSTVVIDVPDYLAKTMDWDTADHGAYVLLLCHYRTAGGPFDESEPAMMRITRMEVDDWRWTRDRVARMFRVENGRWHHAGMDELIAKAGRAKDKATKASRAAHAVAPKPTTLAVPELATTDDKPIAMGAALQRQAEAMIDDQVGTPVSPDFTLTGEQILRCSTDCPDMDTDELASIIDSFKRYHHAAGTFSTDWSESWWRWWERKRPAPPAKPKAKPRVEVSRRAQEPMS
jgi:uncharacterized protein YdaU (DUF1376 family)